MKLIPPEGWRYKISPTVQLEFCDFTVDHNGVIYIEDGGVVVMDSDEYVVLILPFHNVQSIVLLNNEGE